MSAVDPAALRAARQVARGLMRRGARAVVLTGSHARGEAHAHSDIDLIAIAPARDRVALDRNPIRRVGVFLVTVNVTTPAGVRRKFRDPLRVPTEVPGWREAIVLADPDGIAARLKRAAERWSWDAIDGDCDRWVAEQVTGYAEEVHKLAGALDRGDDALAAIQRSILALRLSGIAAVHHRILYGSENVLWLLVDDAMGTRWATVQARALSRGGESVRDSSLAALELYRLLADEASPLLNATERAVVLTARNRTVRAGSRR